MKAEEAITTANALKTQQNSAPAVAAAAPSFPPQRQPSQESFQQLSHEKPAQSSQMLSHSPEQPDHKQQHNTTTMNVQLQQVITAWSYFSALLFVLHRRLISLLVSLSWT